jgi:hypothetical protein
MDMSSRAMIWRLEVMGHADTRLVLRVRGETHASHTRSIYAQGSLQIYDLYEHSIP